ncbi:hypothetical protein BD293_0600 [Roseinatronobacter monicus]|uniref:Uncharacterized protein n=1 Tax=Roseinatronobacter monicus TaxID=393481 RepID=A0A543KAC7_9RHOB|nr:hypothetical protein BD293_0600 [Roseinatronobacter monicus]
MLRGLASHVGENMGNQNRGVTHHSPCAGAGGVMQVQVALGVVSAGAR